MPLDPATAINVGLAIARPIYEAIKRQARKASQRARRVRAYNEIATGLVLGNDRRVYRGFARLWDVANELVQDREGRGGRGG